MHDKNKEERMKKLEGYPEFRSWMLNELRTHPEDNLLYLQVAIEEYEQDHDLSGFLLAIRTIIEAQETMTDLAQKTQLSRQALYKALSLKGNPRFETVVAILNALGYTFDIKPLASKDKKPAAKKSRKPCPRAKAVA